MVGVAGMAMRVAVPEVIEVVLEVMEAVPVLTKAVSEVMEGVSAVTAAVPAVTTAVPAVRLLSFIVRLHASFRCCFYFSMVILIIDGVKGLQRIINEVFQIFSCA